MPQDSVLTIPIPDVLAALGKSIPDTPALQEHARKGMYLSPFVPEKTPSFHWINNKGQNCWHCFATGQGGGVLDLVMLVRRCSKQEAIAFLEEHRGMRAPAAVHWPATEGTGDEGKIIIDGYSLLRQRRLLDYGRSRAIPDDLLGSYLCQVRYHYADRPDKHYTSLGCSNIKNGFTLIICTKDRHLKRCTSCAPTFINQEGFFDIKPTSDSVLVTEGIWDALSWMTINRDYAVPLLSDIVILNSLSTTREGGDADRYIRAHSKILLMLDHDKTSRAGEKKTRELMERYRNAGLEVNDASTLYKEYKDLNDYLQNKKHDNKP